MTVESHKEPAGTVEKSGITVGANKDPANAANKSAIQAVAALDKGKLIVVLDAGHGGSDPGTQAKGPDGKTIPESEINLALSKLVASWLNQLGVQVVLTRQSDVWMSLYSRIARTSLLSLDSLANQKPALLQPASRLAALRQALQPPIDINSDNRDSGGLGFMAGYGVGDLQKSLLDLQRSCDQVLFVSIHVNSSTNTSLHGTQVYYCDDAIVTLEEAGQLAAQTSPAGNRDYANRDDERNRQLANQLYQAITDKVPALAGTNAGKPVLSGNYAVLREQALASVLIETGYFSHAGDLALLLNGDSQRQLADAIADGICGFAKARRISA